MAKRLSKSEYAGKLGLRPEAAESLYQQLRAWKKAKTKEDAKRVLGGISAALGGRGYDPGGMTSEQVEAEKREQIKAISNVEEARRKSAEDYKIALVRAYATKYAQDAGASREAAERAGRLLEIRYKALFPQTFNVGGGSGSGQGGKGDPKYRALTETQSKKMQKAGKQISNMWVREDDGTIRLNDTVVGAPEELAETMREWEAAQRPEAAKEYGRDVDQFRKWAQHAFPGDADQGLEAGLTAPLTELTGLSMTEMREKGILSEEVGGEGLNREAFLAAVRDRNEGNVPRAESFASIWEQIIQEEQPPAPGTGSGGGGLVTVKGITDEQYKALEDTALESLGRVGVGGGGDFSAGLRKIIGAAPAELPGLEAQIGGTSGLPMSQGEAGPGRTPAGEGTLPPGTSGEVSAVVSPGADTVRGIMEQNKRISQGPDASLNEMWQAFQRLDEQRTTPRDRHMLENLQKSAEWIKAKNALGIEDDRKALRGIMMLTRQRKRDARIRDVEQLRQIRKDTNRRALMGGLESRQREAMPPTVDKGSSGAAVMGGAGGFDTPDDKKREV